MTPEQVQAKILAAQVELARIGSLMLPTRVWSQLDHARDRLARASAECDVWAANLKSETIEQPSGQEG